MPASLMWASGGGRLKPHAELRRCYRAFSALWPRPIEHLAWHVDARLARRARRKTGSLPRRVAFRGFLGRRRHYDATHPRALLYELFYLDIPREVVAFFQRGWRG